MQDWMIALLASLFGGAGLKIVEWFLLKGQREATDAKSMRDELRANLTKSEQKLDTRTGELDAMRDKYISLKFKYLKVRTYVETLIAIIEKISSENNLQVSVVVENIKNSELMKGDIEND